MKPIGTSGSAPLRGMGKRQGGGRFSGLRTLKTGTKHLVTKIVQDVKNAFSSENKNTPPSRQDSNAYTSKSETPRKEPQGFDFDKGAMEAAMVRAKNSAKQARDAAAKKGLTLDEQGRLERPDYDLDSNTETQLSRTYAQLQKPRH